ncbi:hypothetical protein BTA51_04720 [Hahella sp. CCB-MM4]|uniref:CesT family type III secretion system chaperone n=1 Tax=Hahella sp. (strain CCB-MM4) TaxID=1926491 RepID=UPI000B9B97F9|nr:CesT family type III secretion system chaperone [Hahella sp. CCB-MM4]OZG74318.1 hypothetical protein BTA51_04720 [Hahella sp. CCB-MM4]
MYKYAHFESLLYNFCLRHRVAMIQPDANLHYVLFVDHIEVRCFCNASSIYLQVELGVVSELSEERDQVYKHVMQQALLDSFSSGCVLSLNEKGGLTLYQRLQVDDCQLQSFEESMEMLANQVDTINSLLSGYSSITKR